MNDIVEKNDLTKRSESDKFRSALAEMIQNIHLDFKETCATPNGCKGVFTYCKGKIEDMNVDYIICPMSEELTTGAGVASAVFRQGGDALKTAFDKERQMMKKHPALASDVICPASGDYGRLKAKSVLFIATKDKYIGNEETYYIYNVLYAYYRKAFLYLSGKESGCSVATPLLCTGAGGLSHSLSAEACINAFADVSRECAISVSLIAHDDTAYQAISNMVCFVALKEAICLNL